jgi:hypothetical protein
MRKGYFKSPGFGVALGGLFVAGLWLWSQRRADRPTNTVVVPSGGDETLMAGLGQLRAGAFQGQVGQVVSLGALTPIPSAPPVPASLPSWGNSLPQFVVDAPAQMRYGRMVTMNLGRGRRLVRRRG